MENCYIGKISHEIPQRIRIFNEKGARIVRNSRWNASCRKARSFSCSKGCIFSRFVASLISTKNAFVALRRLKNMTTLSLRIIHDYTHTHTQSLSLSLIRARVSATKLAPRGSKLWIFRINIRFLFAHAADNNCIREYAGSRGNRWIQVALATRVATFLRDECTKGLSRDK